MIVYLAVTTLNYAPYDILKGADILSSYYYCRKDAKMINAIPTMRNFMLDSGIFTFINSGTRVDMDRYIHEYADFIKANNIKQYVELDVDQIEGVRATRRIRDRLESLVGYPSIPVWHSVRGKESFLADCRDYSYICLGYFLTEGLSTAITEKYAPWFIDKAHENGCRIHGLGFTKTTLLPRFHFDSVDSSTWSSGKRYGCLNVFDREKKVMKIQGRPKNKRISSMQGIELYNYNQWRMYQDYAKKNIPIIW